MRPNISPDKLNFAIVQSRAQVQKRLRINTRIQAPHSNTRTAIPPKFSSNRVSVIKRARAPAPHRNRARALFAGASELPPRPVSQAMAYAWRKTNYQSIRESAAPRSRHVCFSPHTQAIARPIRLVQLSKRAQCNHPAFISCSVCPPPPPLTHVDMTTTVL